MLQVSSLTMTLTKTINLRVEGISRYPFTQPLPVFCLNKQQLTVCFIVIVYALKTPQKLYNKKEYTIQ